MGVSNEKLATALEQAQQLLLKQLELTREQAAGLTAEQRTFWDFMRRARAGKLSPQEQEKVIAFHESAHVVADLKYGVGHVVHVSVVPNDFSEGYVWTKIHQSSLSPLTEDTIKRMFLTSLAGPFAEMYLAGIGTASGDWHSLWKFCEDNNIPPTEVRKWELWTCRTDRDNDPIPGVNWFVLDNWETIFRVACVLHEKKVLTGEEVRSLLWKN